MDCMRNDFEEGVLLDGRFRTVSPLNHGSFGMVFRAVDTLTGQDVALKCLTKPSAAAACAHIVAVDDRSEELVIHRRIESHPNIVNLIHHFETEHHVYLVLEFCANGDLYEAIRIGHGPAQTENVRDCMLQLIDAVEHMHARNIYHRDLKPENIFLSQDGSMKLGDFGLATMEEWSYEASVGSDRYMAPEQYDHLNAGYSPAKADIWAIGICLLNILFSRNPFATPTLADPLFSDFANDRNTLFDVFPNMSQDTYDILKFCLTVDPSKRSLPALKAAVENAVSFTTDDEVFDDEFCVEDTVVGAVSANREPLRTPSISTPAIDQGGAFPWAKALAMSPAARQLSAIPDTEDLFVGSQPSAGEWFDMKPEPSSVASFVDSGLGLSLKSNNAQPTTTKLVRPKPMPISGSLPVSMARPIPSMSAIFKKRDLVSKSWSDLWDEDEEEEMQADHSDAEQDFPLELEIIKSPRQACVDETDGSDTPRAVLSQLKIATPVETEARDSSTPVDQSNEHVSEFTGFVFEEDLPSPQAASASRHLPSKSESLDKWAALGEIRRGLQTPKKTVQSPVATPVMNRDEDSRKQRTRAKSWRRPANWPTPSSVAPPTPATPAVKEWNLSNDWRQHSSPAQPKSPNHYYQPPLPKVFGFPRPCSSGVRDREWVWRSDLLHL